MNETKEVTFGVVLREQVRLSEKAPQREEVLCPLDTETVDGSFHGLASQQLRPP